MIVFISHRDKHKNIPDNKNITEGNVYTECGLLRLALYLTITSPAFIPLEYEYKEDNTYISNNKE